jgi:signal transduction histidine kinase
MQSPLSVLMLEDSPRDALLLTRALQQTFRELRLTRVERAAAFGAALERQRWDALILTDNLPDLPPPAALALLRERRQDLPCVVVSNGARPEDVVAALQAGAHDYVMKDNLDRLAPALERERRAAEGRHCQRRAEQTRLGLDQQIFQVQKIDLLGQLAGGIAHDFNNLLTAITGYAELALGELPSGVAPREDVEEILRTSQRATALTRQLLAFSRRQISEPQAIDLRSLVENLSRMLRRLLGTGITLVLQAEPELWPVWADPGQIEQVLVNLAVNARDAMPGGGVLTIGLANFALREQSVGGAEHDGEAKVALVVSDTGVGMSAEVQASLFEPFFTTKPHGTGLGLTICEQIVRQSGGSIQIESTPDQGTTISILLPRAYEEASLPSAEAPEELPRGDERVLLVDDEPTIRALAARVLRAQGYQVIEAASPDEALRLALLEPPPQLLLTNLSMPHLNGRVLAERLRSELPGLRVLLTSGHPDSALVQDTPFLSKPFSSAVLARKVREVLDS